MTPASINRQQPKFATIPDDPMATRGSAGCWRTRRLAAGGPGARQQLARFFMCYDGRAGSPLPAVAKECEEARALSGGPDVKTASHWLAAPLAMVRGTVCAPVRKKGLPSFWAGLGRHFSSWSSEPREP